MTKTETELEIVNEPTSARFIELVNLIFETETWRINLYDYETYLHGLHKMWLFLNIEKKTGRIVAAVSLAQNTEHKDKAPLFSIGFYFCRPEYRGKGHAGVLFDKAMDIVKSHNCCLTGVPEMTPLYAKKYGFSKMPDYWHIQSKIYTKNLVYPEVHRDVITKNYEHVDVKEFHNYDNTICLLERSKFMEYWIQCAESTMVAFDKVHMKVVGYVTIRKLLKNRLALAPLYADTPEIAKTLLRDVLKSIENIETYECIITTFPECNKECKDVLQSFSSVEIPSYIEQRIQFTQSIIPVPEYKVFGIVEGGHSFT